MHKCLGKRLWKSSSLQLFRRLLLQNRQANSSGWAIATKTTQNGWVCDPPPSPSEVAWARCSWCHLKCCVSKISDGLTQRADCYTKVLKPRAFLVQILGSRSSARHCIMCRKTSSACLHSSEADARRWWQVSKNWQNWPITKPAAYLNAGK